MQFYINNKKFLGDKDKNNNNRKSEINSAKKKDQ